MVLPVQIYQYVIHAPAGQPPTISESGTSSTAHFLEGVSAQGEEERQLSAAKPMSYTGKFYQARSNFELLGVSRPPCISTHAEDMDV